MTHTLVTGDENFKWGRQLWVCLREIKGEKFQFFPHFLQCREELLQLLYQSQLPRGWWGRKRWDREYTGP